MTVAESRQAPHAPKEHFRAFPRRRAEAAVVVRVGRADRRAKLTDISLGGAGLAVEEPLPIGAEVEIVLHAPNRWDPLVILARVAWAKGRRAGLEFLPRNDADAYALFEMLGTQVFSG